MTAIETGPGAAAPRGPGDRAAVAQLVKNHGRRLFGAAQRLLGSADAALSAVAEACRGCPAAPGQDPAAAAAALHRALLVAALRRLPARRRTAALPIDALLPAFDAAGTRRNAKPAWSSAFVRHLRSRTGAALLLAAIDLLPDDHRTLLLLADVEGLGAAGAASLLGIGDPVAHARLHEARQAVRELLDRSMATRSFTAR